MERLQGRKMTEQEINLSLDQARAIGDLRTRSAHTVTRACFFRPSQGRARHCHRDGVPRCALASTLIAHRRVQGERVEQIIDAA